MKICFLAHLDFIPLRDWATYLAGRGHEVFVLSLSDGAPLAGVQCEILRRPRRLVPERTNWQHLLALPRLGWRLRRLRPDLIVAMYASSNGLLGAITRPSAARLAIRVTGTDIELRPTHSPLHKLAIRRALHAADAIVSPAAQLSARLAREFDVAAGAITTLQTGIRLDGLRRAIAVAERAPLCISARQMVSAAHTEDILAAFDRLAARDSPLRLELAHDGPERARLERAAAELLAAGRARFTGRLQRDALVARLGEAALYVSMQRFDGTSTTLLEAMWAGACPVVSDIPANRDWVTDGHNGLLVRLHDPDALADALERAWSDAVWRDQVAARNRAIVAARADFERNMAQIEALLLGLVER